MANYGLLDIVPENLLEDKHIRKITEVIDAALKDIYPETAYPALISRIDELDSDTIDSLAWQWHVNFYDQNLSLNKRRALVKNSIRWHMKKGTKAAVEEMVQTVFESGRVTEWFEYGGEPYHFKIDLLSAPRIVQEDLEKVVRVINSVKNTRSWLDSLGFIRESEGKQYYGIAPHLHKRYGVAQVLHAETSGNVFIGGVTTNHKANKVKQVSPVYDATNQLAIYSGIVSATHKRYKV